MNCNINTLPTSTYIVIGLLINLAPIFAFIDIHGFRPFMYSVSLLYLVFAAWKYKIVRQMVFNKLVMLYILLICYHTINCYLQKVKLDSQSGYLPFFLGFYSNLAVLILVCALYYQNPKKTLKILILSYVTYIILALLSPGFLTSRKIYERAISIYIHPNQLSQCASMCIFIILMYRVICKKSYEWAAIVSSLPIIAIFICGSRNGFFQLLLAIFTFFIGIMLQKGRRNLMMKLSIALVIAMISYIYIRDNSMMGDRLMETKDIASKFDYIKTGTIIDLLGDRQIYYRLGLRNFMDHPIFGIGLRAFGSYNRNFGYPLHSEYMIHVTEGGFVGASFYFLFIFILGKRLLIVFMRRKDAYSITMILSFVCYLMIGLFARECYYVFFFPLLSVLIVFSDREHNGSSQSYFNKNKKQLKQLIQLYKQ